MVEEVEAGAGVDADADADTGAEVAASIDVAKTIIIADGSARRRSAPFAPSSAESRERGESDRWLRVRFLGGPRAGDSMLVHVPAAQLQLNADAGTGTCVAGAAGSGMSSWRTSRSQSHSRSRSEWVRAMMRPPQLPVLARVSVAKLERMGVTPCVCAIQKQMQYETHHQHYQQSHLQYQQQYQQQQDAPMPAAITRAVPIAGVHDKHWQQRYRYFSKFDSGVNVDAEGWWVGAHALGVCLC